MNWQIKEHFRCFTRNERWGTCSDCPRVGRKVYPEACEFTERYDHQLDIDRLVERYKMDTRKPRATIIPGPGENVKK